MPSEQRLHPVSILFGFGKSLKAFAVPGLLVLFTASRRSGPNYEVWLMLLLIPSAAAAVARYLSFRMRYEGTELVIRSGILVRNERHIPYARIQNLDAVQNVFHRLLGVMEVRVETGAGAEPEATISVLPVAAFDAMRRHVFERRQHAVAPAGDAPEGPAATPAARTLLHLPLRDVLLYGFLENRGMVVIGAFYGLLWELGLVDALWRPFDDESYTGGAVRDVAGTIVRGRTLSIVQIVVAGSGIIGLLMFVRLVSMCWAGVRLYGFRLTRAGEDLRTEYGLLTRVAATIPLRRIQTLTVREGPLFRLAGRVSVRVDTAGGQGTREGGSTRAREWLAPLVPRTGLTSLTEDVLPDVHLESLDWQRPHPRAFRRAVKPRAAAAVAIAGLTGVAIGWWALGVLAIAAPWSVFAAWKYVGHLGWAATGDVIAFRSGWLWRRVTVARVQKIQAVTLVESPFDRRAAMARVRVDTAGAGESSHRVDIPYLARETAAGLQLRLAAQAAGTEFSW
jgi:putative membrane protein